MDNAELLNSEKISEAVTEDSKVGIASVLEVRDLRKSYGEIRALDGISFTVPEGKIIGLLGPNGSGKTTFLKIVAGLLTSDFGSVSVCGYGIGADSKSVVAYLPERNSIPGSVLFPCFRLLQPGFHAVRSTSLHD